MERETQSAITIKKIKKLNKKEKRVERGREGNSPHSMAVSKLNDPRIGGQLMDDHNPLKQPPRPSKGPMDVETIPLRHCLNPLDKERVCQFIHDRHTLQDRHNLFTIGAPTTLSLTSQESITNNPFKPPLTAFPNG